MTQAIVRPPTGKPARAKKIELRGWSHDDPEDFVFLDAPAHGSMRTLTARHFTPARCRAMADKLALSATSITTTFTERLEAGEIVDLVHDYAVALPLMTICRMMGVDESDWADIHRWTDALFDVESMRFALPGEAVRWTTPVIPFARTATTDVELHGHTIKAGDHVGSWYTAANRDPRVFDDPFRFDIGRQPNEHLGFGHDTHYCLGANLAKWELRAAFGALAKTDCLRRRRPAEDPTWLTDLHTGAWSLAPVAYS